MEGDQPYFAAQDLSNISIHALRVEGDPDTDGDGFPGQYFYPRPPGGGRQLHEYGQRKAMAISIHALRVEGD